jgi:hypothetical protein
VYNEEFEKNERRMKEERRDEEKKKKEDNQTDTGQSGNTHVDQCI